MKIQNKIALLFTILSGGIILALSVMLYFFATESISESFFHRLEVRSDIVGHAALEENRSRTSIYYAIKEKHLGDLPFEKHRVIWDKDTLRIKTVQAQLPMPASFYTSIGLHRPVRFSKGDTSYVGLEIRHLGRMAVVISSAVDLFGQEEIDYLQKLLVVGFLISLALVFTSGKLFSGQIFKPVRQIIRNVNGISAHNLNQRLTVKDTNDDISNLAKTFNDMLDRLEITFEIQNNFVSNASHEFKTPLTVISGEAQLGLSAPELSEAARQSFTTIYKESERLEHLTNSMLSLAQTGFDGKKEQWTQLRIDELIIAVKEAVNKIMPSNQVEIDFNLLPEDEERLVVSGNEALLKAAFTNIVLNSCKYSDNKPVLISIRADRAHVIVDILDQGIGIPDREIAQIFVPFFRASNTGKYKGYGIGLPLAHNIIRMHKGSVNVESQVDKGTRFVTFLPVA
ncbi:HAMP domain-containing sensor histidine kinase [Dyadobacter sandarakinus]|uniref:histidine kinase n=1 Tax=Dyadobacter sandarakinus TaxID=2747268 RepID=A0ABX7I0T5_9BACT|nr:HAMP domain-containing sensor histidine kinase [Dyadobacter sandarakinus]QRQ99658.1 HAMP domain-containing histidine kinase [Dyadobacter sandarakinus]